MMRSSLPDRRAVEAGGRWTAQCCGIELRDDCLRLVVSPSVRRGPKAKWHPGKSGEMCWQDETAQRALYALAFIYGHGRPIVSRPQASSAPHGRFGLAAGRIGRMDGTGSDPTELWRTERYDNPINPHNRLGGNFTNGLICCVKKSRLLI